VDIYGVEHYKQGSNDDVQFWDDFRYKLTNGYYQFVCLTSVNGRLPQCIGRVIDACRKSVGGETGVSVKCFHPASSGSVVHSSEMLSLVIVAINKEFMVAESILKAMNKKYALPSESHMVERLGRDIDANDGIIIVAKSTREDVLLRMLLQSGVDISMLVDSIQSDDDDDEEDECESD